MDSIAIVKPEMGVLSQERLSLSPFGALSQAFAEELLARAERVEGHWSQVSLDLLQEGENQPATPVRPVIQVDLDLKLVLEALRREKNRSEQLRATERIVERILQRRETLRETAVKPAPAQQPQAEQTQAPQHATQIQQNIYQILNQILRVQRPDGTTGEQMLRQPSETAPTGTGRPGQLGRQAAAFSHTLRILREEGKAFPAPQPADRQAVGASTMPGNIPAERSTTPLDLTHREEQEPAAETAQKSGQQAAVQLLRTAERLERVLRTETARTEEKILKETKTTPIVQKVGPNQEHDLSAAPAHGGRTADSLHTSEPVSGEKQAKTTDAMHTTARQLGRLAGRETEEKKDRDQRSAAQPAQTGQKAEQGQPVTARDIRTVTAAEQPGQPGVEPPPAAAASPLPGVELTHRTEEEKENQTPTVQQAQKSGQRTEHTQPVTARDIRTVTAAEQPGQPVVEPPPAATASPLPGVELTHRTEEEQERQTPTVQQAQKSGQRSEHSQPVTARDIRTVTAAEQPGQPVVEPPPAATASPLPGVELTHRTEEEKESQTPTVQQAQRSGQRSEHSQPVTARDIRTVTTAERPGQPVIEPTSTVTASPLPGVELTHRTEEEQEVQAPIVQQVQKSGQRMEHTQPVTARDIRTVTAAEQPGQPVVEPPLAAAASPLPGVELTHRTEEEKKRQTPTVQQAQKPDQRMEHTQPVTARDIRTVTAAERPGQPVVEPPSTVTTASLPGVELTHRTEEEQERQTPTVQQAQKSGQQSEHTQPVTARDIRTVTTAEQPGQPMVEPPPAVTASPLPGVELTHRTEEEKESQTPTVQQVQKPGQRIEDTQSVTARDIRTVTAAEQPGQPTVEPPLAAAASPLPGVELTHRTEEKEEIQTPIIQQVQKPGQRIEDTQSVTARDIRTVTAAEQPGQPTVEPPSTVTTASLPGVELTHRTEEEKESQTPTVQQSQKPNQRTGQNPPVALRDIRTGKRQSHVQRTTSSHLKSSVTAWTAAITSTGAPPQTVQEGRPTIPQGAPLPAAMPVGAELTLRTGEPSAGQQVPVGMEPPQIPKERFQRGSPFTVAGEDIRVGRQLTRAHAPLREAPEESGLTGVLPPLTLEDRQISTNQPVGESPQNTQRRSAVRRSETASSPVELTYGPSQQTAEQPPAQPPHKADSQGESDYVRSLPDWARRFLKESWPGHTGTQEMGVARNISTQQGGEETVQWTAPNYRPAPPMNHREKRQEEPKQPQQVHISEAEIQRTADRVYRILEDRIREERIRLGF